MCSELERATKTYKLRISLEDKIEEKRVSVVEYEA